MIWLIAGAIVLALFAWFWHISKEDRKCPKLLLGYGKCNLWFGNPCDHSPETMAEAKRAMGIK